MQKITITIGRVQIDFPSGTRVQMDSEVVERAIIKYLEECETVSSVRAPIDPLDQLDAE